LIRHIALLLNFFLPSLGSFLLGKWRVGLTQLVLFALAILAFTYSFHSFYAAIVLGAVWLWGLYTAEYSPRTGGVKRKQA
jgi:hypothetical protein